MSDLFRFLMHAEAVQVFCPVNRPLCPPPALVPTDQGPTTRENRSHMLDLKSKQNAHAPGWPNLNYRHGLTAAAFVSVLMLAGCKEPKASSADAPVADVDVVTVERKPVKQWDEFNGRISAIDTVQIRPRVTGYVERVAFKEGDEVRKGDLLIAIDPRRYQAALDSAQARLERAKASLSMTQLQDRRAQTLVQNNAMSKENADTRRANYLQSQADVRDAVAAVALAKLDLEFTQVRSPINGRASRAQLTLGNLAVADQTVLTSVVSQDPMYVYFDPDEHSYLRYREQARASKDGHATLTVRVGLANDRGFPHTGEVDFTDNQMDASTGTIRLRARLSNSTHLFTPGLFARVSLSNNEENGTILIDDKAVLTDQDRKFVYVLVEGDKAERRDITVGRINGGLRVVESGLEPGDKVIVNGQQRIYFSGAPVRPSEVAMKTSQN